MNKTMTKKNKKLTPPTIINVQRDENRDATVRALAEALVHQSKSLAGLVQALGEQVSVTIRDCHVDARHGVPAFTIKGAP